MKVSEIQFTVITPNNGHVGYCHFVLNDELVFNNVGIHTKRDGSGYRLLYPAIRGIQCVFPINRELALFITEEVSKKFNEFLDNSDVIYS